MAVISPHFPEEVSHRVSIDFRIRKVPVSPSYNFKHYDDSKQNYQAGMIITEDVIISVGDVVLLFVSIMVIKLFCNWYVHEANVRLSFYTFIVTHFCHAKLCICWILYKIHFSPNSPKPSMRRHSWSTDVTSMIHWPSFGKGENKGSVLLWYSCFDRSILMFLMREGLQCRIGLRSTRHTCRVDSFTKKSTRHKSTRHRSQLDTRSTRHASKFQSNLTAQHYC